jgi:hypothetical protein
MGLKSCHVAFARQPDILTFLMLMDAVGLTSQLIWPAQPTSPVLPCDVAHGPTVNGCIDKHVISLGVYIKTQLFHELTY